MRRGLALGVVIVVLAGIPWASASEDTCTPRLLILSAFPGEIDPLLREAQIGAGVHHAEAFRFYTGTLRGHEVALGLTGIGLVSARAAVEAAHDAFHCGLMSGITGIVFSGVSGGKTSIGDVTIPARWTEDDGATWHGVDASMLSVAADAAADATLISRVPAGDPACVGIDPLLVPTVDLPHEPQVLVGGDGRSADPFGGRRFPCFPGGGDVFGCRPCRGPLSVSDPVGFVEGIVPFVDPAFFFDYFQNQPTVGDYDAADMETAAVAAFATEHDLPFIAFRALSDGDGDPLMLPGFPFQFFVYRQVAAENAAAVALAFLDAWPAA